MALLDLCPSPRGKLAMLAAMRSRSILFAAVLLLLTATSISAQQAPPPPIRPDQTVIIKFFVPVDFGSVGQLVQIVDAQIRNGAHKITILLSSNGGDPSSAFMGYNYLRGVSAEITTFNVGNVDSAAATLYCAGHNRYALPGTRFLIHGNASVIQGNTMMDAAALEANLQILKNLNEMTATVIANTTKQKQIDVQEMLRTQTILTPEEAKKFGLVQEIKTDFMEPGAVMASIVSPVLPDTEKPVQTGPVLPNVAPQRFPVSGTGTDPVKP
jgi:ATP-dependent Clp protease, protease subunit